MNAQTAPSSADAKDPDPYDLTAADVIATDVAGYEADRSALRDELVRLRTNLQWLNTATTFPWFFYCQGDDDSYSWMATSMYAESIAITWRIWSDNDQKALTLRRLRKRVRRNAHPQFRPAIQARVKEAFPNELEDIVNRIAEVRHKRVNHVDRAYILATGSPRQWPSLDDLSTLGEALCDVWDALTFSDGQHWVVEQVVSTLKWHLDTIAVRSPWSDVHDSEPVVWATVFRPQLQEYPEHRALAVDLNSRRARRNLAPIQW